MYNHPSILFFFIKAMIFKGKYIWFMKMEDYLYLNVMIFENHAIYERITASNSRIVDISAAMVSSNNFFLKYL